MCTTDGGWLISGHGFGQFKKAEFELRSKTGPFNKFVPIAACGASVYKLSTVSSRPLTSC